MARRLHGIRSSSDVAANLAVYAPGFVVDMPKGRGEPPGHRNGHAGVTAAVARIRAAFPHWHQGIEHAVVEGDRGAVHHVSTGTQDGPFLGRARSGARERVDEISILGTANGRSAAQRCLNDDLAFFKQIDQGGA